MDGSTRIRICTSPYSPKVHDSSWLEMNRDMMQSLDGGVFVADCHYAFGRNGFENVKFHVPYPQNHKKYNECIGYNADIRKIRGLVESPFGEVKRMFKCLRKQFSGSSEQLGYVVATTFGIHNFKLKNLN